MATVWFFGDAHLGHNNIAKHRNFVSNEWHDAMIKDNYHSVVTKRDTVYFMGDTAFTFDALDELATWTAERKILIVGNHDLERGINMRHLVEVYDEVYAFKRYKEFWLSHAPIHPDELRGKVNLHGHVHADTIDDKRYFNTSLENIDYTPINIEVIREILESRND